MQRYAIISLTSPCGTRRSSDGIPGP
jgi:hypothetical protein